MDDFKYTVRIQCMTYNHAAYIEDAMNGFCKQETTFPFVCTIIDDASTDGEQEVIKQYLINNFDLKNAVVAYTEETNDFILTYAQHNTNRNCYFAVFFLKYNHFQIKKSKRSYIRHFDDNSKYVALCEGDDYWVVPDKLQKQVNILDANPDYSCCVGGYQRIKDNILGELYIFEKGTLEGFTITIEDYFKKWYTQPLTCLYRNSLLKEYYEKSGSYKYCRDTHFFYHLLKNNPGYYLSSLLGLYRVQSGGIYSMKGSRYNDKVNYLSMKELFENNKDDNRLRRPLLASANRMLDRGNYCGQTAVSFYSETKQFTETVPEKMRLLLHFIRGGLKLLISNDDKVV